MCQAAGRSVARAACAASPGLRGSRGAPLWARWRCWLICRVHRSASDQPFVYDDVSFILGARAVADTGRPFGNQGYLLHLYWERDQWALWHPPLYIYLLGATWRCSGDSEPAARGLGVPLPVARGRRWRSIWRGGWRRSQHGAAGALRRWSAA